jgi:small subunit ribosomal protein S17
MDKRKVLVGNIVSNKMNKTVVVSVQRKVRHPKYEKLVYKRTKCYAHNENSDLQVGQEVRIMECRPLSKMKRWIVIK